MYMIIQYGHKLRHFTTAVRAVALHSGISVTYILSMQYSERNGSINTIRLQEATISTINKYSESVSGLPVSSMVTMHRVLNVPVDW